MLFLTYFSHFLVTREKLKKFFQHITDFEKKVQIYQVRFLFGMSPGVDSYLRHFGTINK